MDPARHRLAIAARRAAFLTVPAPERDAWLDRAWDAGELPDDNPALPRGSVPYLPCPASTVLEAVRLTEVTAEDVFVDIGAGLGRAAALVHLLTGAGCIGIEIQPTLVRAARGRAEWRGLDRVRFLEGDAATWVRWVMVGTVFFLYCPFGAGHLERFLDGLEEVARTRPIRVCCVGMGPIARPWLTEVAGAEDLVVYRGFAGASVRVR
ncbi:MAG: methyltransferase domain-containing protein [Myxococcales bacterium]|nr:methyltransferase domain-containing protein [Myxococcales bacterium]